MAGVGRGALRPSQGGKQYFAVVGLVIILIGLGANYWSFLARHKRLLSEFDKLRVLYQTCSEKMVSSEKTLMDEMEKVKSLEKNLEDARQLQADRTIEIEKYSSNLGACKENLTVTVKNMQRKIDECARAGESLRKETLYEQEKICGSKIEDEKEKLEQLRRDLENNAQESVKQAVAEAEKSCEIALQEKQKLFDRETELQEQALEEVSVKCQKQLDFLQKQQESKNINQSKPQEDLGPISRPQDQKLQLKETPQSDHRQSQESMQDHRLQAQDKPTNNALKDSEPVVLQQLLQGKSEATDFNPQRSLNQVQATENNNIEARQAVIQHAQEKELGDGKVVLEQQSASRQQLQPLQGLQNEASVQDLGNQRGDTSNSVVRPLAGVDHHQAGRVAARVDEQVTGALRRHVPLGFDSASRMRARNSAANRQQDLNNAVDVNLGFMRRGDGETNNAPSLRMGNIGNAHATAASSSAATGVGISNLGIADVNPIGRMEKLDGRDDSRAPNGRQFDTPPRGEYVEHQHVVAASPEVGIERRYFRGAPLGTDIGQRQIGVPVAPGETFKQRLVEGVPPGSESEQQQIGVPVAHGESFEQRLVGGVPPGAESEQRQIGAPVAPEESFKQRLVEGVPPGSESEQRQIGVPVAHGDSFEQRLVGGVPPGAESEQRQIGADAPPGKSFEQRPVGAAPHGAESELQQLDAAPHGEGIERQQDGAAPAEVDSERAQLDNGRDADLLRGDNDGGGAYRNSEEEEDGGQ